MGIANACCRVRAGARARSGCSTGLDARACARSGRARHSPQCQHMTHASRSAAPPTPRSARRGARASTRATHESARRMDRARPRARARPPREGGPSGSARPTARAPSRPRSHENCSKISQPFHNFPPLDGEKKVFRWPHLTSQPNLCNNAAGLPPLRRPTLAFAPRARRPPPRPRPTPCPASAHRAPSPPYRACTPVTLLRA